MLLSLLATITISYEKKAAISSPVTYNNFGLSFDYASNWEIKVLRMKDVHDSVITLKDVFPTFIDEVAQIKDTLVQEHKKVKGIVESLKLQASFLQS